jgi:hypothetical protein
MNLNRKSGLEVLRKYLGNDEKKFTHSTDVGNCSYMFADILNERHPKLKVDKELVGFLGYTHDIGQSITPAKHELKTIELLVKECVPLEVAFKSMHGQLLEQFGQDSHSNLYVPVGYEGKIITVADMSVDPSDGVIAVEDRAERIKAGVTGILNMPQTLKDSICNGMDAALPRFQKYRDELFGLMGINLTELQGKFAKEYQRG